MRILEVLRGNLTAVKGARLRFDGWIAGIGTSSGTRVVLGHWTQSPFGPFSDVMLEQADGERLLLAPTRSIGDFIASTYSFEHLQVVPVTASAERTSWAVEAGSLTLHFTVGRRRLLGLLLRAVPGPLAARPAWAGLENLPARLLPGVRTRGSAGDAHREWYGVLDLWPVTAATAAFEGHDLGRLAPVDPPVRFGFGSVPRRPALVRVTTTVERGGRRGLRA
ncbi:hypothetical protein ACFRCW_46490 [Streptomyces sp. NPDC056653]|uniref:hypothetical protein n=1 Tax=Streptomyces sp. NPDC056653 TaxID=3345894 RepID=UPI0036D16704